MDSPIDSKIERGDFLKKGKRMPRVSEYDKYVMMRLTTGDDLVNKGYEDCIKWIRDDLLSKGKSLYPLIILYEVSLFYSIPVLTLVSIGFGKIGSKTCKARMVAVYMMEDEAAGLVYHSDISEIVGRGKTSKIVTKSIEYVTSQLRSDLDNLRDDISKIHECLNKY